MTIAEGRPALRALLISTDIGRLMALAKSHLSFVMDDLPLDLQELRLFSSSMTVWDAALMCWEAYQSQQSSSCKFQLGQAIMLNIAALSTGRVQGRPRCGCWRRWHCAWRRSGACPRCCPTCQP